MSYGESDTEMSSLEYRDGVASKPAFNRFKANDELPADRKPANRNNLKDFNMCLGEPKVVLDKTVVSRYFKTRKVPTNLLTLSSRQTADSDKDNTFLVQSEKCPGYTRNRLSVNKDLTPGNMLNKEKEVALEGPIFSRNNNLFGNINHYIAQQSIVIGSSDSNPDTHNLDNRTFKASACRVDDSRNHNNFLNDTSVVSIEGESVEMECGDDILFTHGADDYDDENAATTNAEPVELECGDDILFTNDANYCESEGSASGKSDEMECGDDILFTEGAGYYDSDGDGKEGNQEMSCDYEDVHTKIEIEEEELTIIDTFEKPKDKVHHCNECHYETFDEQELHDHVASHYSDISNKGGSFVVCENCGRIFTTLSALKEHQFEAHGVKYFYTCKFCPSTSWYSSTLKNHIETVHSLQLDKENIDDIMKNIKLSKEIEKSVADRSTGPILKKAVVYKPAASAEEIQIEMKKLKKKKYIDYTEAKKLLYVFCPMCRGTPNAKRKRVLQYCTGCTNQFAFQCLKCDNSYRTYSTAWKHAKFYCKMPPIPPVSLKKPPKRRATKRFYIGFCAVCNQSFERKDGNTAEICVKCKKNYMDFQCKICKRFYKKELLAMRHSTACHRQWRNDMISASLAIPALLDHNYYCRDRIELKISKIFVPVEQPPITELAYCHETARKVYSGKKSQSG